MNEIQKFDYDRMHVAYDYLMDRSLASFIMGPVGSGKTVASILKIRMIAEAQEPSSDNIRYTRFAIVRNTYSELKSTTIKTWQNIFPPEQWGDIKFDAPITHNIKKAATADTPGLDLQIIFISLSEDRDIKKLMSLECTGIYWNEVKFIPGSVVATGMERTGRYPSRINGGVGPTWFGMFGDTNAMDEDHWYHHKAEIDTPNGWEFYKQPPAASESTQDDDEAIRGGGKWWRINPDAENMANLPDNYYHNIVSAHSYPYIQQQVLAEYCFVKEGKPVWPEYNDDAMVSDLAVFDPALKLFIGMDFGGSPAAVLGQRDADGRLVVIDELETSLNSYGLQEFAENLSQYIQSNFGVAPSDVQLWGDPSGQYRGELNRDNAFSVLRLSYGFTQAKPTSSNLFDNRQRAGASPMLRYAKDGPSLRIHSKCKLLRKALAGGYHYRRTGAQGKEGIYTDKPEKNDSSHIGDAYMYLCQGMGEQRIMEKGPGAGFAAKRHNRVYQAGGDNGQKFR